MTVQGRFKRASNVVGILSNKGKGTARVDDVLMTFAFDDGQSLEIRFDNVKRYSFNALNGLWAMRLKSGERYAIQTTGLLFAIGARSDGVRLNDAIKRGLRRPYPSGVH